jgi:alpha-amylase
VHTINGCGDVINLFMDYETLGEHQWEDTGIFNFIRHLPEAILRHPDMDFVTVSEEADRYRAVAELSMPYPVSWADTERDLSAWLGNAMQQTAIRELYALEQQVKATKDIDLLKAWRQLQTSDHFYYMCTKWFSDGDVHKYFNAYERPHDAYVYLTNALAEFTERVKDELELAEAVRATMEAPRITFETTVDDANIGMPGVGLPMPGVERPGLRADQPGHLRGPAN